MRLNLKQIIFLINFIFRAVSDLQQNWARSMQSSYVPWRLSPPPMHNLPCCWHPASEQVLVTVRNVYWYISIVQSPQFTVWFTFGGVHSLGLGRDLTYTHTVLSYRLAPRPWNSSLLFQFILQFSFPSPWNHSFFF